MITIDKMPNQPNEDHDLFIDGRLILEGANVWSYHHDLASITVTDEKVAEEFSRYSILELPPIECLHFHGFECEGTPLTALWFRSRDNNSPTRPHSYTMTLEAEPDLARWNKPYTFAEYCVELGTQVQALNVNRRNNAELRTEQDENKQLQVSRFYLEFPFSAPALPLANEINRRIETFKALHKNIEEALLPTLSPSNGLAVSFRFPEQVRVPCEQYLIYFVEFLRDLGIKATSDLKHEAGRVLFTVIPQDPLEALDNIRTALDIYLQLPSNPISDSQPMETDIATQKLLANVSHLTGQLRLANALIETQKITIQAQQATINQTLAQQIAVNQKSVRTDVVVDSIVEVIPPSKQRDREEFLSGTFALTKYQGKGFEINIPELIRLLKRHFGKSV